MSKTSVVHVRLDPKIRAELEKKAKAENRTTSNYIESLILRDLRKATKAIV